MNRLIPFCLLILLLIGCESDFSFVNFQPPKPATPPFTLGITKIGDFLDPGSSNTLQAATQDKEGNIYSFLNFNGSLDGVTRGKEDVLIQKFTHDGELLGQRHINSSLEMIQDNSEDELPSIIVWSEKDKAVYFVASTQSSLIENSTTKEFDIFFGKISHTGEILWIKHLGETSVQHSSQDERGLDLIIPPDGYPLISSQTKGHLFETNAGGDDVGIFKINPTTGEIVRARQLGADSLLAYGNAKGITVDGSQDERTIEGNFDLDGDKAVLPIRTKSSLIESINSNT